MTLTEENIDILNSLTSINDDIYFQPDNISTCPPEKNILVYYSWGVKLDKSFGIHKVSGILSALGYYEHPVLTPEDTHLTLSEGKRKNKYPYTLKECIDIPPPLETFTEGENASKITSSFILEKDDLVMIKKQMGILKAPHVVFHDKQCSVMDIKNSSANTFTIELDMAEDINRIEFDQLEIQRLYNDTYEISFTDLYGVYRAKNKPLVYVVAKHKED